MLDWKEMYLQSEDPALRLVAPISDEADKAPTP